MPNQSIIKIIFFEELNQKSVVRTKLRVRQLPILPPGYRPLSQALLQGFNVAWFSRKEAWPDESRLEYQLRSNEKCLALSIGHVFNDEQLMNLKTAIKCVLRANSDGPWFLKDAYLKNIMSGECTEVSSECLNLNSEVQDFDFSHFAHNPRQFNKILFEANIVTKTCFWKEKGLAEVGFLNSVPASIKAYYPKLIDSETKQSSVIYKMQNLRQFDLGRLVMEKSMLESDWKTFYEKIFDYFSKLPTKVTTPIEVRKRLEFLFVEKLALRMNEFRKFKDYERLSESFKESTGKDFEEQILLLVKCLKTEISVVNEASLKFSHGDLCFSNILYDLESKEVFFVDPRGENGEDSHYRPVEYDLAKLAHSALGGYESIARGEKFSSKTNPLVEDSYIHFLTRFSISRRSIRLYEASLFWSMLPLHSEFPEHILQFMLAGENALQEVT